MRDVHGERAAHAVAEQRRRRRGSRRAERRHCAERSAPNTSARSRKPSAICGGIAARRRGDRRELRRQRIRDGDRLAVARRCRSRSGSSRRSRARDARSTRRRRAARAPWRAAAAAASASRPSRSAACGAAARDCGSARESARRRRRDRRPGGAASVGITSSIISRSISVASMRIGRRLPDEIVAGEKAEIGERRVAAVQEAQLHRLERRDVGDELRAGVLPARARAGEAVLDHPLRVRLGDDRRGVGDAEQPRGLGDVGVGRRRHDAIDHRARERRRCAPIHSASDGIGGLREGASRCPRPCARCAAGCRSRRR